MSEEWVMPETGNIVLALTDDDLGIEGHVEVDHVDGYTDGGIPNSDSGGIAAIPMEHRVYIGGRVETERLAVQALADAVEKSKKDRRDVYISLFEAEDTTPTGKVSDQRTDPKREENSETAQSSEDSSPDPGRVTGSKGMAATAFPIRAKPCKTDAAERSQWCKKDTKQKEAAIAEKPLPERNFCCSKEFTEVHSQDFAKYGKDTQNLMKQEPSPRKRCPKEKSSKPPLPMTIMRLL